MKRIFAALACVALTGCVIPLTPAELARNENHNYPGHSRAQVYKAAATALRSLGYDIAATDGAGRIKTAPKLITATAYGSGSGSAVAIENSFAWTLDVTSATGGAALHAEPRGYSGGQVLPPSQINGSYLKKLFSTLYSEIDADL